MTRAMRTCSAGVLALGTIVPLWGCTSKPAAGDTPETAQAKQASAPVDSAAGPRREQALLDDLAVANRILARKLAILDVQGHVTARSRTNPNHYYIARFIAPGDVTTSDFVENDLDSHPVDGPRNLADRAFQVRQNAIVQQQAVALRGKVTYLADLPQPPREAGPPAPAQPAQQLGPPEGRAWVYWSQHVSVD